MEGRVRWFFGFARNSGGYSLAIMGTPCDVPDPRKIKEKAMLGVILTRPFCYGKHAADGCPSVHIGPGEFPGLCRRVFPGSLPYRLDAQMLFDYCEYASAIAGIPKVAEV